MSEAEEYLGLRIIGEVPTPIVIKRKRLFVLGAWIVALFGGLFVASNPLLFPAPLIVLIRFVFFCLGKFTWYSIAPEWLSDILSFVGGFSVFVALTILPLRAKSQVWFYIWWTVLCAVLSFNVFLLQLF
ncbi:MAG: hypothetical protein RBU25_13305 [Lentisphaeria bacterium]|jgi:hypothetical protein|nr:hypothetical protein [Lentisphaeria bacterium]